jgi:hypothetical protein
MAMGTHIRAKNVSYLPLCPELESYIMTLYFKNLPLRKEFKIKLLFYGDEYPLALGRS